MSLPPRDLSCFTKGTEQQRAVFASALLEDYMRTGFAKLVNHGISEEDVQQLFEWNRRFFRLSPEAKQVIAHPPGPKPQRGWSRIGAENSSKLYASEFAKGETRQLHDAREHFDQGSAQDTEFPNQWPEEAQLPGFRDFMQGCFERLATVTMSILEALELAAHIPRGSFTGKVTNAASELRLLHYPAIDVRTIKGGEVNRIWPHFDLGVITLLFQDTEGGLEMQDRTQPKAFVPVVSGGCSELVTNISETLQRWTNGKLKAGLHQVTLPSEMKALDDGTVPDRHSVAFFCKADRTASVGPMAEFVSEARPAAYGEMNAIEYQQQRLLTAY